MTKKRLTALSLIAALLITVCYFTFKHLESNKQDNKQTQMLPLVTAASVRLENRFKYQYATGPIVPVRSIKIQSTLSNAPIMSVLVDIGDHVRKGQLLAAFDDTDLRANKEQLQASLQQSIANLRQASNNQQRALSLQTTGSLSASEILQYTTSYEVALAQHELAKNQLVVAENQLAHARVVSPVDGIVSARRIEVGAVPAVGAEMFSVVNRGEFEWNGQFSASQVKSIRAGQLVALELDGGIFCEGKVRAISPVPDPNSQLYTVFAILPTTTPDMSAHAFGHGSVQTGSAETAVLPMESIVIRDARQVAYVVTAGPGKKQVYERRLELGQKTNRGVQVLSGVHAGDMVITKGAGFLNDRDWVTVQ